MSLNYIFFFSILPILTDYKDYLPIFFSIYGDLKTSIKV